MGTLNLNRPDPDEESFEVKEVVVRDDYDVFTGKANLALLEVLPYTLEPFFKK